MTPATLSAATLLVKARRDSVPSARRIVEVAARRLGLDWRTCSPSDRLRLLHAVRLLSGAWLQRAAEEAKAIIEADGEKALFGRARAAADRFFRRAHKFIGSMVLAGVMAFLGPGAPTTIEAQAINQQTEIQRAYLQRYEQEVMDERKPLDAARAAQYGAAVWTTTHSVVRTIVTAPGSPIVEEYAEHRGVDEPCTGCQARLAQGRVPVGTLAPIGATPCRIFCHCVIIYVDASGTEYFAGRGPLHEPVFGTRGLKSYHPGQARDAHGRWTSAGGGRYQHNTAITGIGYHADIHRITQEINSSRAGPGHSKRRIWRARVRSRKQGQLRIKVREHRKKIGRKLSAQRRRNEARRAREVASETRYHEQDLAKLDREHAQAGTTGSAEHVGRRERLEREHTRLMGVMASNHRYDRDAERTEYRYEAALARQHHRDTEAIYLRQRHERLTEGD